MSALSSVASTNVPLAATAASNVQSASDAVASLLSESGSDTSGLKLSALARLLSKLAELQLRDDEAFKKALAAIADALSQLAVSLPQQADNLNKLADRFSAAAEDGDLSAVLDADASSTDPVAALYRQSATDDSGALEETFLNLLDTV